MHHLQICQLAHRLKLRQSHLKLNQVSSQVALTQIHLPQLRFPHLADLLPRPYQHRFATNLL